MHIAVCRLVCVAVGSTERTDHNLAASNGSPSTSGLFCSEQMETSKCRPCSSQEIRYHLLRTLVSNVMHRTELATTKFAGAKRHMTRTSKGVQAIQIQYPGITSYSKHVMYLFPPIGDYRSYLRAVTHL